MHAEKTLNRKYVTKEVEAEAGGTKGRGPTAAYLDYMYLVTAYSSLQGSDPLRKHQSSSWEYTTSYYICTSSIWIR